MCALSVKSDAVDERPGKEMERHIPNYLTDFYAIVWKLFLTSNYDKYHRWSSARNFFFNLALSVRRKYFP